MDVVLQRHCAKYIYVVPEGLRELLSDISREVLRSQPTDLYTFIADYLDALLITRENARVAARFVQHITESSETVVELLNRTGMTREEANKASTIIQHAFKAFISRKGIIKLDEDKMIVQILEEAEIPEAQATEACVIIQNAYRNFKLRHEKEKLLLSGCVDWRIAARSTMQLYRRTGVSHEEAKRAANLIKAAYKGYYTRKNLQKLRQINEQIEEEEEKASVSTISSEDSAGNKKSKSVRIDYNSVIAHVDFGDQTVISTADQDSTMAVRAEEESTEEFIRNLITVSILSPIGEEKQEDLDQEQAAESVARPPVTTVQKSSGDSEIVDMSTTKEFTAPATVESGQEGETMPEMSVHESDAGGEAGGVKEDLESPGEPHEDLTESGATSSVPESPKTDLTDSEFTEISTTPGETTAGDTTEETETTATEN